MTIYQDFSAACRRIDGTYSETGGFVKCGLKEGFIAQISKGEEKEAAIGKTGVGFVYTDNPTTIESVESKMIIKSKEGHQIEFDNVRGGLRFQNHNLGGIFSKNAAIGEH